MVLCKCGRERFCLGLPCQVKKRVVVCMWVRGACEDSSRGRSFPRQAPPVPRGPGPESEMGRAMQPTLENLLPVSRVCTHVPSFPAWPCVCPQMCTCVTLCVVVSLRVRWLGCVCGFVSK